tara:strand:- start:17408 stop:17692 length:285 start_codon:yes stop_codon:yes gene_type:complete
MKHSKYSNAGGYGFWCWGKCVDNKVAAGIPPLGAGRAAKVYDAQGNLLLGQAAQSSSTRASTSWTATQTAGVAVAGLLTIGLVGVLIVKAKRKK